MSEGEAPSASDSCERVGGVGFSVSRGTRPGVDARSARYAPFRGLRVGRNVGGQAQEHQTSRGGEHLGQQQWPSLEAAGNGAGRALVIDH